MRYESAVKEIYNFCISNNSAAVLNDDNDPSHIKQSHPLRNLTDFSDRANNDLAANKGA